LRAHGNGTAADLRAAEEAISTWGTDWKAWLFYSAGRFREALDYYALASRRAPKNDTYLARRGEIHLRLLEVDSAIKYVREAIVAAGAGERNADRLVRFYKPKAVYEYMLGSMFERKGDVPQAREAYGRALTEDLSLFVAHQRLGLLALAVNDTAAALGELRLATEIAPKNAVLRYQYAAVLTRSGRLPEAVPELKLVIDAEPWYTEPYMLLARLYDASDLRDDAKALYTTYLARARRDDPQRALATQRLAALAAAPGAADR
jgi:tetratricopeptide (TPR) repeat protein